METSERRRVRQRKPELMLQAALNDAEELSRAVPTLENVERMRLVKARLFVLKSRVNRELTRRVEELETENERLKHQHEQDSTELERLRAACRVPQRTTALSFEEIAQGAQGGENARNV